MVQALALRCKESLEHLDVSFCRGISEQSLGLVADRCSRIRRLVIFGCSQVGTKFLNGHSNEALAAGGVVGTGTLIAA